MSASWALHSSHIGEQGTAKGHTEIVQYALFLRPWYFVFMRYYTTSQISAHRHKTPEGYLLCVSVPIARTGLMEYLPEEVPEEIAEHAHGKIVQVYRLEADVFAPETMASFEGKPLTLEHPDSFVTPENWQELAVGLVLHVRRGAGEESDLLLADLLVTNKEAIKRIESGELREVSCGYDADYEEVAAGTGKQTNIIGNHLALVPHGRCGARCAIKDMEPTMTNKKTSFWDRIMGNPKVKKAMDEAIAEEGTAKKEGEQATDNTEASTQLAALATKVEELTLLMRSMLEGGTKDAEEQTGDEDPTADEDPTENKAEDEEAASLDEDTPCEKKATDRAMRKKAADADTVNRANLLAPALRARVGDSACAVKRNALRTAMRDAAIKRTVDACLRGSTLENADCFTLDAAFMAASEVAGSKNNSRTADAFTRASVQDFGKAITPADINRMNREFHDKKAGK